MAGYYDYAANRTVSDEDGGEALHHRRIPPDHEVATATTSARARIQGVMKRIKAKGAHGDHLRADAERRRPPSSAARVVNNLASLQGSRARPSSPTGMTSVWMMWQEQGLHPRYFQKRLSTHGKSPAKPRFCRAFCVLFYFASGSSLRFFWSLVKTRSTVKMVSAMIRKSMTLWMKLP